jgi:hypothetical protein
MPVRTLNYTNRLRILREDARITIREEKGGTCFDASLRLIDYKLPGDARVFVEAYRQTQYMRFYFGPVGAMHRPDDRRLSDFDFPEGIKFRVKVVTETDPRGLLLAEADQIRPRRPAETDEDKRPLLECQRSRDIGNEIWKLDFSTGDPVILVNADLENALALAEDSVFSALVAPSVLRTVFAKILDSTQGWDEEDLNDWRSQWIYFARNTLRMSAPPASTDKDKHDDWIDDAAKAFCEKTNSVVLFRDYWPGAQEQ